MSMAGSALGTLSFSASCQNPLDILADAAIALHEKVDLEAQSQLPPSTASALPVSRPTEISAPTEESKHKRAPAVENEAQSVHIAPSVLKLEGEAARPVRWARNEALLTNIRAGVQPPTPEGSSRRRIQAPTASPPRGSVPGPAPEASPLQPPTTCKQDNSLSPFQKKHLKSCKTVDEMVEVMERSKARGGDWARVYRVIGRSIRPEYDFWRKEQLEWVMSAAIQYENDWDKVREEYQVAFPEAKPRTKHAIYSKWARQWEREEKLRQEDPSKAPNRPGQDKVRAPVKRSTPEGKKRMIEKALEIMKSKQKS